MACTDLFTSAKTTPPPDSSTLVYYCTSSNPRKYAVSSVYRSCVKIQSGLWDCSTLQEMKDFCVCVITAVSDSVSANGPDNELSGETSCKRWKRMLLEEAVHHMLGALEFENRKRKLRRSAARRDNVLGASNETWKRSRHRQGVSSGHCPSRARLGKRKERQGTLSLSKAVKMMTIREEGDGNGNGNDKERDEHDDGDGGVDDHDNHKDE